MSNQVLVPCAHGMNDGDADGCLACEGSGHVRVVPALDGKPVACLHASHGGKPDKCIACLGSGWAGFVER
jgi:hypothetical protein